MQTHCSHVLAVGANPGKLAGSLLFHDLQSLKAIFLSQLAGCLATYPLHLAVLLLAVAVLALQVVLLRAERQFLQSGFKGLLPMGWTKSDRLLLLLHCVDSIAQLCPAHEFESERARWSLSLWKFHHFALANTVFHHWHGILGLDD